MTNHINSSDRFNALPSPVELELLEALLEPDDGTYPWNPADQDSETYFDQLEQEFSLQDFIDEEITIKSSTFYDKLDQLWSEVPTNSNHSVVDNLQVALNSAFADSVPQNWLQAIAEKTVTTFASQQSMGDQLVQCVQSLLPTWDVDDLLVLTRPFTYAMRSNPSPEVMSCIHKLQHRDWLSLSEIEQAKISVAIAYYAFRELNTYPSELLTPNDK
ncbi:hypothetical protein VB620_16495 [Nodularia harveyana UHCC-0300]|uniref:Uncharacterized protein n=1 Tax=Nodularia harveyana UHCC-0300 TaxID=2974287 RepID=A0ABU5UHE5_9CYAN|nr:hypothetical protein [Nodularia harveyana]MEA5582935.1 hypothetical protein [Nodularia harveyana UHCC-0300]